MHMNVNTVNVTYKVMLLSCRLLFEPLLSCG